MTIEIKQLIIRARVDATPPAAAKPAAPSALAPASTSTSTAAAGLVGEQLEREREAIVAACVREVMRRLDRKRER
jgi:hypothetical protein